MCAYKTIVLLASLQLIPSSFNLACLAQEDLLPGDERGLLLPDFRNYDDTPTPNIIRRYGYPSEVHLVTTDDGYILELHRIPHGKNRKVDPSKKPVLVQHGVLTSSADWVLTGPKVALGFLLADKGYDVWLGNIRGNTYSRKHVTLSPDELKFWDFSFHEMGIYDIPACIDYILNKTNQDKINYIGHSMGTTVFFVMTSMRPEYNDKILVQLSLAPIAYMGHMSSVPIRLLVPIAPALGVAFDTLTHGEVLGRSPLIDKALQLFCTLNTPQMILCQTLVFIVFGIDPEQFKHTIIPPFVGHDPAGISAKTLVHYAQIISNPNTFRQFDYGLLQNVQHYNSSVPPDYNISAIRTKVGLFYGDNDPFADPEDVKLFYPHLPNPIGLIRVNHTAFNHLDFLWAKDVIPLLYNQLFQILDSLN